MTIFDRGVMIRRQKMPSEWIVSAAISDAGDVALGSPESSHVASLAVLGANGTGAAKVADSGEIDGFRPAVPFFPGGQRWSANSTPSLSTFTVRH
jgi:hypothetical protein